MKPSRAADHYVPTYFLASLGAGGLSVTFFMYLMFWVPHPGRPVPVFEDILAAWGTGSLPMRLGLAVAIAGIAVFVFLNLKLLIWNLSQHAALKQTERYTQLRNSNAESTLLAMPVALAMSVNGLFIAGLVFVPNLWSIVEYLFPFAMIAFGVIGWIALSIIGDFLGRVLSKGGVFDVTSHNSFAQMLPAFALSMVGVGFAAPAAMSHVPWVVATALVLSTFFAVAALVYSLVALTTAFNSMLHYGTHEESGPTLLIVIPIVTILSILFMRQNHGLHTFDGHSDPASTMMFLARMLSLQVVFLGLGLVVLKRQGYFKDFVFGSKTSAGSYALVCPGVALSVLIQFFVNSGLVQAGVIAKFGVTYWAITAVAIAFQIAMIALVARLNAQHFSRSSAKAVPAE
ncbi:TsoY family (seleno)protein [Celeribacter sp.]|uniref:TsoY family (seleno)protein n=1 Tax=Celeribacter sp. TaxID=1890673 RepID=UPI003A9043B4